MKVKIKRKMMGEGRVVRNIEDIPLAAEDMPSTEESDDKGRVDGRMFANEPVTVVYEPQEHDEAMIAIQDKFDDWVRGLSPKHRTELRATISSRICPAVPTMNSLIGLFRNWSAASKGQLIKDK
jgi:hypothetical protein